ncbi:MAG: ribose 5-phosphate isomerase B [Anaerolineae bacterium]|nr:ribose 5-phosphate isomerase B [Anaerolineae bacterium]MCB9129302.1 ribose 5-phosphate isomerase B [Anaerolineales bacterium]MCP5230487.1 ribose 5-phosphate isomerase B [Zoogloeaceae bacterium]MCB0242981.1 ribose 5-phosphate isomerase B [Anaerolineae bacterium]MCB0250906.1 ribose 5-phosphate isomerase B [Anaerolineae bacterium]
MVIAVAADHAGYEVKEVVADHLRSEGYEVLDLGVDTADVPSDYPDAAAAVAQAIRTGEAERGVLVCGSGVGVSVAANKFPGIRAAICHDTYSAHQGVEHDQMNVLVLGGRIIGAALARELVDAFMAAEFSGEERHVRRVDKVLAIEREQMTG